tara:strand:- start:169 stop:858 length:690 start_codon:yes stop_codon:yes gene_type:complete
MRTKILITALILTQTLFSQNENSRKIGDFDVLKVYDLINIELIKAEENRATITGQHSNNVVIINKNGELRVRMGIERRFRGANTKVKIYYNNIEKIYVNEGAYVFSKDTIAQPYLYVRADEGAKVSFDVSIRDLSTNTSSGSIMDLSGKVNLHRIKVNTGGEVQASKLIAEETDLFLSTGGVADVYSTEELNINIRAGGRVNVHSKTKKIVESKIAGGTINYLYEKSGL